MGFGPSMFLSLSDYFVILGLFSLFFVLPSRIMNASRGYLACFIFISLAFVKMIFGLFWVPQGLEAGYYANPRWEGIPESSWTHRELKGQSTRIDPQISFGPYGFSLSTNHFPLYFANNTSFNWYGKEAHKRTHFQFSAGWKGQIHVLDDDPRHGVLLANDFAEIKFDADPWKESVSGKPAYFDLTPGSHDVLLRYSHHGLTPRKLILGWADGDDKVKAIPSSRLSPGKVRPTENNPLLMMLSGGLYVLWTGFLVIIFFITPVMAVKGRLSRKRAAFFSVGCVMMIFALLRCVIRGIQPDAEILTGGDDWLTYESMARNILMGDIFDVSSTGGGLFYYFPLYRYLLAGLHLIVGESVNLIIFAQYQIMIFVIIAMSWVGYRLYSLRAGILLGLQGIGLLVFPGYLLDTTFNILFSSSALFFLILYGRDNKAKYCVLGGTTMAIACMIRGNFLPFVPFAMVWIFLKSRMGILKRIARPVFFCLVICLAILSIGLRNHYVSGEFKLMATNGPVNIWLDNHPPGQQMPASDELISTVLRYAVDQPIQFSAGLLKKAAYIAGIREDFSIKERVFIPSLLAIIAGIFFVVHPKFRYRDEIFLLLVWIGVNDAILIITKPWVYGWRLVAPTFPALFAINALWIDNLMPKRHYAVVLKEKFFRGFLKA